MHFVTAWMDGFRRYAQFTGRASRVGFWSFFLGNMIVPVVLYLLASLFDLNFLLYIIGLWNLITLVPTVAVGVRRLHDRHMSGWWLLIWLTGIGAIVLLVLFALEGDPGPNRYGPQPGNHASTSGV